MGRVLQHPFHIHKLGNLLHFPVHLLRGNAVILQRESNILCHGQANKLTIGIPF